VCAAGAQADERDPTFVRHLLEDHPMAPFLALKHHPFVFTPASRLAAAPFFEAMSRDPIAFLASVNEKQAHKPDPVAFLSSVKKAQMRPHRLILSLDTPVCQGSWLLNFRGFLRSPVSVSFPLSPFIFLSLSLFLSFFLSFLPPESLGGV